MFMQKIFINNRYNKKLAVIVEENKNPIGLAFVMHGLGDSKDSKHIKTFSNCFKDNGYTVICFDTTNTGGENNDNESDGVFEDSNISTFFDDLEDVITWTKKQSFYIEPFILCGHSLGAISSAFYAENHPEEVKALAPISTVINAELSKEVYTKEELENWEKTGWLIEDWGKLKVKIKWSYLKEKENYDLLKKADKLTMPVFMMVGQLDHCTLPRHQQILFDELPGSKCLYMISGAPHTFRNRNHLDEASKLLDNWIKTIN